MISTTQFDNAPPLGVPVSCRLALTTACASQPTLQSPECFYVEKEAQRRMSIPVFHDDQHGTAIVAGAGLLNALEIIGEGCAAAV